MSLIIISNPKGGTGKSTFACLLTEYLNHIGTNVKLMDMDPNQTSQWWIDECSKEGRKVSTNVNFIHEIVDTAGLTGAALSYLNKADFIIVLFQPQAFDLKVTIEWIRRIETLNKDWLKKLLFIVNRWQNTKDQKDIILQFKEYLEENKKGELVPFHLGNRPTTYASFLEGRKENFFSNKKTDLKEVKSLLEYLRKKFEKNEENSK